MLRLCVFPFDMLASPDLPRSHPWLERAPHGAGRDAREVDRPSGTATTCARATVAFRHRHDQTLELWESFQRRSGRHGD
eukprot:6746012-Prymnesium_polylepis.1